MVSENPSARGGRGKSRRFVALVVGLSLIAAAGSLALTLTNAGAARSVAASATSLQWSNAASGAAAVARLAVHQALVFEVDVQLGVATDAAAAVAASEARNALSDLDFWINRSPAETASGLEEVLTLGTDALDRIEAGDPDAANELIGTAFEPAYATAVAALADDQALHAGEIGAAQADAGRTERITQLLVTLLIPATAIIIHQLIVRRQVRDRQLHLEASLEAERELNRSKDTFIASLSHELRTPLTSIFGFAEYLIDQSLTDPDEAIELITMIKADSSELSRMVEDLLVAARLEAGTLSFEETAVDLVALATEEAQRLERDGRSVQIHSRPAHAWGTRKHIQHIVRNLISNAVRYGGGKVDIVVDQGSELATVTVADSGPGVPEDVRERIFERFVNEGEQTLLNGSIGLGLSVAQTLAEAMGGAVHYERRLGWTNFIVALPLAPADLVAYPAPPGPAQAVPLVDVAATTHEDVVDLDWSGFFAVADTNGELVTFDGHA